MKKQTTSSLDVKRVKTITTVLIALVAIVAAVTTTTQLQQQAQARSILGNTADGYEEGKDQGVEDSATGSVYDTGC